ncbi:MAG: radical SAM-associated putative lipoprotein [Muribaculaceae bacterium]|nr:radical SAM-associated putative lipoprotein [Muribaculaceae bacterium]
MIKQTIKKQFNLLLSAVLALLGFSACDSITGGGDEPVMYGTPYGDYEISGLVTDEASTPLSNMRVIVSSADSKGVGYRHYDADTVYTDEQGHYMVKNEGHSFSNRQVYCEDPAGVYEADSTVVKLDYKGGSGWYQGEAVATADLKLKKKAEPSEE